MTPVLEPEVRAGQPVRRKRSAVAVWIRRVVMAPLGLLAMALILTFTVIVVVMDMIAPDDEP